MKYRSPGVARGPDVAVVPVLAPAGLVRVHHGTRLHALAYLVHLRPPVPGDAVPDGHQFATAQLKVVNGLQVPLDRPQRQPPLLGQRRNQAHQPNAQALLPQHVPTQCHLRYPALPAARTAALQIAVLRDPHRRGRDLDDFPPPLDRATKAAGCRSSDTPPYHAPRPPSASHACAQNHADAACVASGLGWALPGLA
jgi:hypothetical protein